MIEAIETAADAVVRPAAEGGAADLFKLGRAASVVYCNLHGKACLFSRSRRLLNTGAWHGPKDAAESFVEEADVAANGGLAACAAAGVRTLIASSLTAAAEAQALQMRCLLRLPYQSGELPQDRAERLRQTQQALSQGLTLDGVVPSPIGEAFGLDTLLFFAQCRMQLNVPHVVADFARLGHRLAQMALAFGASELHGPIVSERALRLGDNANNPSMTRKEVVVFIKGAALVAHERLHGGRIEEVTL
ncbi:MAG: hypothetical protein SF187_03935 [Deltaproteobacteria bacterium]|nr:hypothetical protein [Deltaproteobacteria bacterium]